MQDVENSVQKGRQITWTDHDRIHVLYDYRIFDDLLYHQGF